MGPMAVAPLLRLQRGVPGPPANLQLPARPASTAMLAAMLDPINVVLAGAVRLVPVLASGMISKIAYRVIVAAILTRTVPLRWASQARAAVFALGALAAVSNPKLPGTEPEGVES